MVEQSNRAVLRPTMRYLGETLDHLACSMMAFQDWPPRDQLTTFYQAAREQADGNPISWRMAKALLAAIADNKTVILATGEWGPNDFKYGETDGPVGIAVLARALASLGCKLVFVCDPHLFGVHRALVDRFAQHCHRVEIDADSWRETHAFTPDKPLPARKRTRRPTRRR